VRALLYDGADYPKHVNNTIVTFSSDARLMAAGAQQIMMKMRDVSAPKAAGMY
jgi:hypothetical protein